MSTIENDAAIDLPESEIPVLGRLHEWVTTVDHERLGLMYIGFALLFFVIAGLQAATIRLQLAVPNAGIVPPQVFNRLMTVHGTAMVFLVGMPILTGFFNYLVPLMIGARDLAFPRLNAFVVDDAAGRRDDGTRNWRPLRERCAAPPCPDARPLPRMAHRGVPRRARDARACGRLAARRLRRTAPLGPHAAACDPDAPRPAAPSPRSARRSASSRPAGERCEGRDRAVSRVAAAEESRRAAQSSGVRMARSRGLHVGMACPGGVPAGSPLTRVARRRACLLRHGR